MSGLPAPRRRTAMVPLLDEWYAAQAMRVTAKQLAGGTAIVRRFLWRAGISTIDDVTCGRVEGYLAGLCADGRSGGTVRNHASAISSFCQWLMRRGLLAANPCRGIPMMPKTQHIPTCLSDAEIADAVAICRQRRTYADLAVPMLTGLRRGELTRLLWADVDLDRRQLLVKVSKGRRPRLVPLSREALLAFRYQRRFVSGAMAYVFPARRTFRGGSRWEDRPRAEKTWRTLYEPVLRAVPRLATLTGCGRRLHAMRHTFASRLARKGVSLYKIAKWLGHRDIRTTEIYAHLQDGYDKDIEL